MRRVLVSVALVLALIGAGFTGAALITHTWATELVLTATGVAQRAYRVDLIDTNGREIAAGSFLGTDGRELRCKLNAAIARSAAASAAVYDSAGRLVLTADLA